MQEISEISNTVNITKLINRTLSYLKAFNQEGALLLSKDIEKLIPKVKEKAQFNAWHECYDKKVILSEVDAIKHSDDLCKLVGKSDKICIIAATLGIEADRYIKRIMLTNASQGVILDALCSAYLEEMTDEYEDRVIKGPHTFRFAPGYGDLDLSINRYFHSEMKLEKKLGVTINDGGLFIPQKSMLGIVGVFNFDAQEPSPCVDKCMKCIRLDECEYRKEDKRCWM